MLATVEKILTLWEWTTVAVAFLLYAASLYFAVHVLLSRKPASATWAWLFSILLLPIVGALAYLAFGHEGVRRPRLRQRRRRIEVIRPQFDRLPHHAGEVRVPRDHPPSPEPFANDLPLSRNTRRHLLEASKMARVSPTRHNRTQFLDDGQKTFEALLAAIDQATHHVHLLFYIVRADSTGRELLEHLMAARRRGVEVRLLADYVGSFATSTSFFDPLREAGGKVAWFMPVKFFLTPNYAHLRNHRKIVIVDGRLGFTGGINVGDEYRHGFETTPWGQRRAWADVFARIEGPAALDLQEIFIEDWLTASGEDLSGEDAYFHERQAPCGGDEVVQILSSGPDESTQEIHSILFSACSSAERRAWFTTPYFIPTEPLMEAMKLAAIRGVDIRLLFPGRLTNHPMVFYAGRWYYRELLEAGVRIFEYTPGLVHAKLMMIDGEWGSIGSANMDIRSFRLNFELNALVFSPRFTRSLEAYFERCLEDSQEVTLEAVQQRTWGDCLLEGIARLFSPVL